MIDSGRLAQFEKMASADPTNEMAHFSLGSAYLELKRYAESAKSLERCIQLAPEMSKAYELCGTAMIHAGWADKAVEVLLKGYALAVRKGDRMPQEAMGALLKSLGRDLPRVDPAPPSARGEELTRQSGFICRRSGKSGTQLARIPFKGPLGQWIYDNISAETWKAWIGQGTKVINELRLDFSRDKDQEVYDQHMRDFLGIDDDLLAQIGAKK